MSLPETAAKTALELKDVCRHYVDGQRLLEVLKGVNLTLSEGEFISIVGSSGSGKSTLLHIIGALDKATKGEVLLEEMPYSSLSEKQLAKIRSEKIGFVFQFHHLLPEFTALENVIMPGLIARRNQGELAERGEKMLTKLGLKDRMEHRPGKLSGGEQQRVAIARALLNEPNLVLADEPTGNLDRKTSQEVLEFLVGVTKEERRCLILVTHDNELAAMADRKFVLKEGVLSEIK